MYQKILAKLLIQFAGLPQSYLGLIAKQLEAKVTDENQIEGAISELDAQFPIKPAGEEFQKEGDRRVTDAQKAWAAKQQQGQQQQQQGQQSQQSQSSQQPDDTPAWAKVLIGKIDKLEKEKAQGTIRQQIEAKLKDVPKIIWGKWALPEKEEDIEAFITEATTDYAAFKQEQINAGFMNAEKPEGGQGGGGGNDKAIDKDIEDWASKKEDNKDKK